MISIITAAAFALAWFSFRYERHRRWRDAVEAAHGALRAVHHGMVQGLTPGQAVGWGQIYFSTIYTEEVARARARETIAKAENRMLDYVLVVPTEPLARLATTPPQDGLIDSTTVAVANFALWRVHAFNQLVRNMNEFLTSHADEITSENTDADRRHDLAAAAGSLSLYLHLDGIGGAWAAHPGGSAGWYRALVEQVSRNKRSLADSLRRARWHWLHEWPYPVVDVFVVAGFLLVTGTEL